MNEPIRCGIRSGIIFSVLVIFLVLIGFTVTASEIFGNLFGLEHELTIGNERGLLVFFGLIGLGAGLYAPRGSRVFGHSVLAGLISGVLGGLLIGGFAYFLGMLDASGIDMREYFVQLSSQNISLFLYGQEPLPGALINFGLFTLTGLLGGSLYHLFQRSAILGNISGWRKQTGSNLTGSSLVKNIRSNPNAAFIANAILFLVLFSIPLFFGNYWNYTFGTVGIYVLMGLGLNIVVGLAGLLDLGYVAFFAIGAYSVGLLTSPEPLGIQLNFWIALLMAVMLAALSGIILGVPVLRMRGDYLAIVTLGFGEIIRVLAKSDMLASFAGGPQGVRAIAGPSILGESFIGERDFLYMIILAILLVIFVTTRLQHSRVGRAWVAMREDETVAQAQGINTLKSKLLAFAIGAAFAGLGGVLFASRNQYTGPEDHNLLVSINVLCLVIVGGMGSIPGVIAGAFVLKGLPEVLRQLELYRLLAFGALLVVMMIWRPEGIWPAPRRRIELHEEEQDSSTLDSL
jgi:branched-chain amino acid transport system permease protein